MTWPPLPKTVRGAAGPITVKLVKRAKSDEGEDCFGTWESETRTICIERGIPSAHKYRILFHELTHAALDDAGIAYLLTEEGNESICEAMATSRVQQMRGEMNLP